MIIRVDEIKPGGLLYETEEEPCSFPLLDQLKDDRVFFERPIVVRMRVVRIGDLIEVDGNLETTVRLDCARCLKPFDHPVSARFDLTYSRALPTVDDEEGEEVELSAEDMGISLYDGDEIDCIESLQEQIVMALPLHALCREDCKGICPRCGVDKNQSECSCAPETFNSKFAALKDFKIANNNE